MSGEEWFKLCSMVGVALGSYIVGYMQGHIYGFRKGQDDQRRRGK